MDQKKYREILETFGEVKVIKVPKNGDRRESDEVEQVKYQGQMIEIGRDNNPTLTIALKRLHCQDQERICDDCGLVVKDRRTERRVCTFPELHWRETCATCHKTRHPISNEFTLDSRQAVNVYREHLNNPELRAKMPGKNK